MKNRVGLSLLVGAWCSSCFGPQVVLVGLEVLIFKTLAPFSVGSAQKPKGSPNENMGMAA